MKKAIFYFSGVGNSKAVAKEIASQLSFDLCKSIRDAASEDFEDLTTLGLVFPVYYFAPPTAIMQFIETFLKPAQIELTYLFTILTNGGMSSFAPSITEMLLQQAGYLSSYCETVKMVDTYTPLSKVPEKDKRKRIEQDAYESVKTIIKEVGEESIKVRTRWPLSNTALYVYRSIAHWRYTYDRKFIVDDTCTECGICVRSCPVNNIELHEGKIRYLHHCEQCFACYHKCPVHAIQLKRKPLQGYTYYQGPDFTARNETI